MKHSSAHRSPAEILMYGHHRASGGSMPSNEPHFQGETHLKKGGRGRPQSYMRNGRSCHAEGDTVGVNPVNGYEYPGNPENKRRGGSLHKRKHRAEGGDMVGYAEGDSVYAEGDTVDAAPYRKGGRTHNRRRHHSEGGDAYNEGGDVYAEGDTVGYAEGDSVPYRRGGRTRRAEGGDTYNEGDSVYAEGGDTSDHLRRGGRLRKRRAEGGDTYNEGGDVDREHHSIGDIALSAGKGLLSMAPFPLNILGHVLKKGGPAHNRRRHHSEGEEVALKRAMGGVGKLRKGMMG